MGEAVLRGSMLRLRLPGLAAAVSDVSGWHLLRMHGGHRDDYAPPMPCTLRGGALLAGAPYRVDRDLTPISCPHTVYNNSGQGSAVDADRNGTISAITTNMTDDREVDLATLHSNVRAWLTKLLANGASSTSHAP